MEASEQQDDLRTGRKDKKPRKPKPMTAKRLHNIALAYLDRYEASEATLRRVLERRVLKAARAHGDDPADYTDMISDEVAAAVKAGHVNNKRFAENQVYQQRNRGGSSRMISARLSAKGIESSMIADALNTDDRDDRQAAYRYAQRRRFGPFRQRQRAERRDKDIAALCRAGFGFSVAVEIIDGDQRD